MSLWDYTKLAETIDAITGKPVQRRAQHVILFDAVTGAPAATGGGGGGGGGGGTGTSTFDLPAQAALTTTARALMGAEATCRSLQVQAIKPDGSPNTGLIAIGTTTRQTIYIAPGDFWNDSTPLGNLIDLSQIFVRALTAGDCITLVVRS